MEGEGRIYIKLAVSNHQSLKPLLSWNALNITARDGGIADP